MHVLKNGIYNRILTPFGWDTCQLGTVEVETYSGRKIRLVQETRGGFEDPHWRYWVFIDSDEKEMSIHQPGPVFRAFKELLEELQWEMR